jgi:hypothetical protein
MAKTVMAGTLGGVDRSPAPESAVVLKEEPRGEAEEPQQTSAIVLPIPNEMWMKVVDDLTFFIEDELTLAQQERGPMMDRMARWRTAYIAPMAENPKNFPIHNASDITIPLIKEHVHTLVAQIVQSTTTARPWWVLKDMAKEWEPFVDDIEIFLDLAATRDLKLHRSVIDWIIEAGILGTSIMEVAHEVDERRIYQYTSDGKKIYPKTIIFHDGPRTNHVPIASFWIRMHERDLNKARWFAKRLLLSEMDLKEKVAIGKFIETGVEEMLAFYDDPNVEEDKPREAENKALEQKSVRPSKFEIFEIYVSFDVDDDGRYEELRLYYHRDSRKFIGRQFLPNWNGKRGFVKLGYFPRTDRFYDEGIAEMLEQIQLAVSAIVNRRADNSTLANLKMILKRKIVKSLQPGDPLYAGKQIEVGDIWNDMREFSLSEIYPSTISEEQILRQVADRLSGLNEASMGAAMPVSRTTASAQLALLQEQRNRIGLTVGNVRDSLNEVGSLTTDLYSQFGTNGKALAWMGERGRLVEVIFRLPRRATEIGLALRVSTPTSSDNRQVKRENAIGMFNLLVQLYEKLLPLASGLAPDAVGEVARSLVKSARHYMQDVLESFEQSDPETVLEGLATLERLLPAPEDLGGLETFNRTAQTTEILDSISRVEGILREAEAARDGNNRVRPGDERPRRTTPPERNGRGSDAGNFLGGESLFRSRG